MTILTFKCVTRAQNDENHAIERCIYTYHLIIPLIFKQFHTNLLKEEFPSNLFRCVEVIQNRSIEIVSYSWQKCVLGIINQTIIGNIQTRDNMLQRHQRPTPRFITTHFDAHTAITIHHTDIAVADCIWNRWAKLLRSFKLNHLEMPFFVYNIE